MGSRSVHGPKDISLSSSMDKQDSENPGDSNRVASQRLGQDIAISPRSSPAVHVFQMQSFEASTMSELASRFEMKHPFKRVRQRGFRSQVNIDRD